jgi:predicted transcriptional regulator of viral defense system
MTEYSLMAKFNPEQAILCFVEDKKVTNLKEIREVIGLSPNKTNQILSALQEKHKINIKIIGIAKVITYNENPA